MERKAISQYSRFWISLFVINFPLLAASDNSKEKMFRRIVWDGVAVIIKVDNFSQRNKEVCA